MMKSGSLVVAVTITAGLAAPAHAAPTDGDTVTCAMIGFGCSSATATVGPDYEFGFIYGSAQPVLTADFSNGFLTIRTVDDPNNTGGFGTSPGFSATFADTTSPFTMATLTAIGNIGRFDQSDITFANGIVSLDLGNVDFNYGGFVTIQLGTPAAEVPEPATWATMLFGLGLAGGTLRSAKRRRMTALA